jgi:hypothetical protein
MQGTFSSDLLNTPAVSATGTNGAEAINASSDGDTVIEATSDARTALLGGTNSGIGVIGRSLGSGIGVLADSNSGTAVNATSQSGVAVLAQSSSNFAVQGQCMGDSFGVVGIAPNAGVAAFNPTNEHAAYLASECCAAWFTGDVAVTGSVFKGGGGFKIDHPLDPARKFLAHSFVESSDMKNLYDGVVVADASGEAVAELPDWFEALNHEFRYQLTPVGSAAPELHVKQEIQKNRFKIAGANPGMKICWQVTGIRRDPWAMANRIVAEEDKNAKERGHYLHPHLYGAAPEKSIEKVRHPGLQNFVKNPNP